jgi:hypothetical protein
MRVKEARLICSINIEILTKKPVKYGPPGDFVATD